MVWEGWLTLVLLAGVLGGMIANIAQPVSLLFIGLAVLTTVTEITGTEQLLAPEQAVAGFGNTGLVTVGLLFVVAAGVVRTGAVARFADPLLGRPSGLTSAQGRLLVPVAGLSAFINNTPIVAMFLPAVQGLARRAALPPSRLFLPLSYASILGGTCTLIGTSTNLVVYGLAQDNAALPGIGIFELAWVGVPLAVIGLGYIMLASPYLLAANDAPVSASDDPKRYTVEVVVDPAGPLVGRTVEAAGLRHLRELFLVEIERDGQKLPAVAPEERLQANDRLVFVGVVDAVVEVHRIRGLRPATDQVNKLEPGTSQTCLVEAVVSNECPLVGQSIRAGGFRGYYNAAVIAVARGGRRLRGKIGDIVLETGDTLLLETNRDFIERHRHARDFFLVSGIDDSAPRRHEKAWQSLAIVAGMVAMAASGVLSMLTAALVAATAMVATGCATLVEARRSVDWQVLLVIGAALGLGHAMTNSGAATALADQLIASASGHPWLVLAAVFALTSLFTEMVTNNAAAVLMFPVAIGSAKALGVSPMPFIITLMIGASASFSTPLGYQTNLMVYGPGGYRPLDYLRFGLPLNLITGTVTVGLAPLVWSF